MLPAYGFVRTWSVVLMIAAMLAGCAYATLPVWDDALIELLLDEAPQRIAEIGRDRPVMYACWQWAADTGRFWEIGAAANLVATLLTAVAARTLWIRLFASSAGYWPIAAVLAACSILFELQATLTPVFQLQTGLVYLAALAVWPLGGRGPSLLAMVSAAAAVAATGTVSEYVVSAALAVATPMAIQAVFATESERPRRLAAACCILVGAAIGYGLFRTLTDPDFRLGTNPTDGWAYLADRGWAVPLKLLNVFKAIYGGALFHDFAAVDLQSRLAAAAAIAAAIAAECVRRDIRRAVPSHDEADPSIASLVAPLLVASGAACLALVPLLVMGRTPTDEGADSRFYVAVVPLFSCIVPGLVLLLCRARWRSFCLSAVVFAAVLCTIDDCRTWLRAQRILTSIGDVVRPRLSERFTLVMLDYSGTDYRPFSLKKQHDFELAVRCTRSWTEDERRRVWIVPLNFPFDVEETADPAQQASYRRIVSPRPGESTWRFERYLHGFRRAASVDRVLVVTFPSADQPRILDVTPASILAEGKLSP